MPTVLVWRTSVTASCWHAVESISVRRATIDDALAAALAPPAERLRALTASAGITQDDLFAHLVPLSIGLASQRELATVVLAKCAGRERAAGLVDELAGALGECRRVYDSARPDLDEQLALRSGPFEEQWEARGGGLLSVASRLAEPELLPEEAQVALVDPILGGGGAAHPRYNLVRCEAVLANPAPQLPEVLRLAWLVSQLNLDLPRYSDRLARPRLLRAGRLALVPIVLAAGAEVELTQANTETIALALDAWHVDPAADSAMAATVDEWWQVYADTRPELPAALVALDRMLAPAE